MKKYSSMRGSKAFSSVMDQESNSQNKDLEDIGGEIEGESMYKT
jgi:hypothetical protein